MPEIVVFLLLVALFAFVGALIGTLAAFWLHRRTTNRARRYEFVPLVPDVEAAALDRSWRHMGNRFNYELELAMRSKDDLY